MIDTTQELFDIVDEGDNLLGIIKPRNLVHKEMKDWHRTTAIFIINDKVQLLCQQRSFKKDSDPGAWHCFFGGHLKAGEEYKATAIAEVQEEIGLELFSANLIHIGQGINTQNKHHAGMFTYRWNGNISDLNFNDGEVEQVKWMNLEDYAKLKIKDGNKDFTYNELLIQFLNSNKLFPPDQEIETFESAGGVVINPKGQIIVASQGTSWSLPKGIVEPGEEILTAAKREIYEETGVSDLELIKPLGKFSRSGISRLGKRYSKTIHIYLFTTTQTELKPIDPHNPEALWIDKENVAGKLTYKEDKAFFESIKKELS
jgi:ADP-ribose pyrophosphatase YjhB (NUDIX family)